MFNDTDIILCNTEPFLATLEDDKKQSALIFPSVHFLPLHPGSQMGPIDFGLETAGLNSIQFAIHSVQLPIYCTFHNLQLLFLNKHIRL